MISWSHIISELVHADLYHAYRCLDHMLVGFQCLSPLGVLVDVVTKLPSLELSIVVMDRDSNTHVNITHV